VECNQQHRYYIA